MATFPLRKPYYTAWDGETGKRRRVFIALKSAQIDQDFKEIEDAIQANNAAEDMTAREESLAMDTEDTEDGLEQPYSPVPSVSSDADTVPEEIEADTQTNPDIETDIKIVDERNGKDPKFEEVLEVIVIE